MEQTKQKFLLGLAGAVVGASFIVYLVFYQPLFYQMKIKGGHCHSLEGQVKEMRKSLGTLKIKDREKVLINEEEVSMALRELTLQGKSAGVNFVSVTPKEAQKPAGSPYRILPIETELESTYEAFGTFLGSLDKLQKGIVTVGQFKAVPSKPDSLELHAQLTLNLYLGEKTHAE